MECPESIGLPATGLMLLRGILSNHRGREFTTMVFMPFRNGSLVRSGLSMPSCCINASI